MVLENLYAYLKEKVDFFFDTPVETVRVTEDGYELTARGQTFSCKDCVISVGRSGSKWMENICRELQHS